MPDPPAGERHSQPGRVFEFLRWPSGIPTITAPSSIPVILLARLAVDKSLQGKKIGPVLLKDALIRSTQAADTIGARAVLVHAKDDNAKGFYEHFTFEPSASDPYHLLLIMKDLRRIIEK